MLLTFFFFFLFFFFFFLEEDELSVEESTDSTNFRIHVESKPNSLAYELPKSISIPLNLQSLLLIAAAVVVVVVVIFGT